MNIHVLILKMTKEGKWEIMKRQKKISTLRKRWSRRALKLPETTNCTLYLRDFERYTSHLGWNGWPSFHIFSRFPQVIVSHYGHYGLWAMDGYGYSRAQVLQETLLDPKIRKIPRNLYGSLRGHTSVGSLIWITRSPPELWLSSYRQHIHLPEWMNAAQRANVNMKRESEITA